MGAWKKRLTEVRARNPDALPGWLRGQPAEPAWYRVEWQSGSGVPLADATRPALVVLRWLAGRGLLTTEGAAVLTAADAGAESGLAVVAPAAARFLDAAWERWWETHGINLAIGPGTESAAAAALDVEWQRFDKGSPAEPGAAADGPRL